MPALLSRITKAEIGSVKLELQAAEKALEDLEEQAKQLPPANPEMAFDQMPRSLSPRVAEEDQATTGRALQLIPINPSLAVLEVWWLVEREVRELARRRGVPDSLIDDRFALQVAQALKANGVFTSALASMLNQLRNLRNQAAHGRAISEADAREFMALAQRFVDLIRKL